MSFGVHGFPEDCLAMLLNIKGNYFHIDAVNHCNEDQEFFRKCFLIFEVLNWVGYVDYDIMCTQKEAKA